MNQTITYPQPAAAGPDVRRAEENSPAGVRNPEERQPSTAVLDYLEEPSPAPSAEAPVRTTGWLGWGVCILAAAVVLSFGFSDALLQGWR